MQATALHTVDTEYSADSLEFSPHDPDLFVVGTYQLEPVESNPQAASSSDDEAELVTPPAKRKGLCLVYRASDAAELQRIDGPAILDLKWNPNTSLGASGLSELAIADAEGRLMVYQWDQDRSALVETQRIQITDPKTLVLSLDWSNRIDRGLPGNLITSLSSLSLAHLIRASTGELVEERTWAAHDYEPWIAAFDGWNPNIVYSGGDDLTLKGWDLRTDRESPIWTNKKTFDGGVTCIQTSPHEPNLMAVGSYNSTVAIFDPRNPLRPVFDPIPIGGGAWRVKFHPSPARSRDLLIACMHDGFKVVRLQDDKAEGQDWSLLSRFDGHDSLAYGCDWSRAKGEDLVGSCSFYDHQMCLWHA